jgi:hypothetical protein
VAGVTAAESAEKTLNLAGAYREIRNSHTNHKKFRNKIRHQNTSPSWFIKFELKFKHLSLFHPPIFSSKSEFACTTHQHQQPIADDPLCVHISRSYFPTHCASISASLPTTRIAYSQRAHLLVLANSRIRRTHPYSPTTLFADDVRRRRSPTTFIAYSPTSRIAYSPTTCIAYSPTTCASIFADNVHAYSLTTCMRIRQ